MKLLDLAVPAAFALSVSYVVIFATGKWWTNIVGRTQMNLAVVIMLVLGLAVLRQFFELGEWLAVVRIVVYVLIFFALLANLIVLILVRAGKVELPATEKEGAPL